MPTMTNVNPNVKLEQIRIKIGFLTNRPNEFAIKQMINIWYLYFLIHLKHFGGSVMLCVFFSAKDNKNLISTISHTVRKY